MNPGGPDLGPSSSILDRVKMFLPVIAQANVELEKQISGKGAESVAIDTTMLQESSDEEDEDDEEKEGGADGDSGKTEVKAPMIRIDFALGDFDGTPIALAEEDKEGNSCDKQNRGEAMDEGSGDHEDDEGCDSKTNAVSSLFRVDR